MAEPVSLDLAKSHLRILDDTSEDALITGYIVAAREWVENYTGHALVQREFVEAHAPERGVISLYRKPIVEVSVADFADTRIVAGRLFPASGSSWPALSYPDRFTVTYTAGYAEGEVPQALIQAVLLLVGHFWSNREAATDRPVTEVPMAVESLCGQFRSPGL